MINKRREEEGKEEGDGEGGGEGEGFGEEEEAVFASILDLISHDLVDHFPLLHRGKEGEIKGRKGMEDGKAKGGDGDGDQRCEEEERAGDVCH